MNGYAVAMLEASALISGMTFTKVWQPCYAITQTQADKPDLNLRVLQVLPYQATECYRQPQ